MMNEDLHADEVCGDYVLFLLARVSLHTLRGIEISTAKPSQKPMNHLQEHPQAQTPKLKSSNGTPYLSSIFSR